jgi:hypothetical protein
VIESLQFFTVVARNYLAYAYVLGESVRQSHSDAGFSVFVMDDADGHYSAEITARGLRPLGPADVALPNYRQFVFQYNVTEASTAVKPAIFQYLLAAGAEKIIYLDPDICCYRRFDEVLAALDHDSLVLTPHSTSPIEGYFPDDSLFLNAGVYNLGFLAVRRSPVTERFLAWWGRRLQDWCLEQPEIGLFVDQKWMDLVPAYFPEVHILKSLAYNIAYWNLHERWIAPGPEAQAWRVLPGDDPVAFIHFSGMRVEDLERISKYGPRSPFDPHRQRDKARFSLHDRPDLLAPFRDYAARVTAAGLARYLAIPYAFNSYADGTPISQMERSLFLTSIRWKRRAADPFAGGPRSFQQACRRAGVAAGRGGGDGAAPSGEFGGGYQRIFRAIQWTLKLALRLLGPDLYAKFAVYMRRQFLLLNHDFLLKK